MKNRFLTLLFLVLTSSIYAQNTEPSKSLDEISSVEETFVHYTKEIVETSKKTIAEAVDLIVTEGVIITKQYIIYTSITHFIPILIGLFLIFGLSKRIINKIGISREKGDTYNLNIENNNKSLPQYKHKSKLILYNNRYYEDYIQIVITNIGSISCVVIGCILIYSNLLDFIKVTFFSKLYLTEIALKYLA